MKTNNALKKVPPPIQSDATATEIGLAEIHVDPAIQGRVAISQIVVRDYSERMKVGDKFPPLILFNVDGKLLLADGAHRLEAARSCGMERIACNIRNGTRLGAIRFVLGANRGHGMQRTNADKRRCAEIALREFPGLSDGAIAEMCGVSDRFANKVRRHAGGNGSDVDATRTGRDGKKYRVCRRAGKVVSSQNDLPNFYLPLDPTQREQALSTYFTGLAEQICTLIIRHPVLAKAINAAMYVVFGKVIKQLKQLQPMGDSNAAPRVVAGTLNPNKEQQTHAVNGTKQEP